MEPRIDLWVATLAKSVGFPRTPHALGERGYDAETLSQAIRRHHQQSRAGHEDPLSLPRLLSVFVKVCEALADAHSRGIIHRALNPENVVLGDCDEAIVLEWDLVKQIGGADEETAPLLLTEDAQSLASDQGR